MATGNRNLIVMPDGKNSLHKDWGAQSNRSYDVITLVYSDEFVDHEKHADQSFRQGGTKTQLLAWFFENHRDIWEHYSYFRLAEDDLAIEPELVNEMFAIAEHW